MDEKRSRTSNGYRPNAAVHDTITCRGVLNVILFVGFMVNYMLRVNLTFAIVDMVSKLPESDSNDTVKPVDDAALNRSVRSAYLEVNVDRARRSQAASFFRLLGAADSVKPKTPDQQFEFEGGEEMLGEESSLDYSMVKDKRDLLSSRNLVAEGDDSVPSFAGAASSNDTVFGLNETDVSQITLLQPVYPTVRRFNWTESQQGYLIGCFFWGYIATEIPGGRLAEVYGARRVFGYATLGATVLTLVTPLAAKIDFTVLIACRVLLGFCLGPTWPAVLPLAANWVPPDQRGKFLSNMMASTLGAGFTLAISGFIIATFSWEFVFYVTGMISLVWTIAWFLLIYDSPASHPRISASERRYIETQLGLASAKSNPEELVVQRLMVDHENFVGDSDQSDAEGRGTNGTKGVYSAVSQEDRDCVNGKYKQKHERKSDGETHVLTPLNSPVIQICSQSSVSLSTKGGKVDKQQSGAPWLRIITSVPVWAFVLTHGASVFGYFTITNQLPSFMKYILKYDIKKNGVLSGLPYIGKYLSALIGGSIADYLLKSSILSRRVVRKLFTLIGVMVPGLIMIMQVFVGSDKILSIIIFISAMLANGFVTGGYLGNSLELAPNYSGTIFGLANMFSGVSGSCSALLVGYLTNNNQVYGQWQKVFAIVAGVYIVGALLFLFFGSTETQSWNSKESNNKKVSEVITVHNPDSSETQTTTQIVVASLAADQP